MVYSLFCVMQDLYHQPQHVNLSGLLLGDLWCRDLLGGALLRWAPLLGGPGDLVSRL